MTMLPGTYSLSRCFDGDRGSFSGILVGILRLTPFNPTPKRGGRSYSQPPLRDRVKRNTVQCLFNPIPQGRLFFHTASPTASG